MRIVPEFPDCQPQLSSTQITVVGYGASIKQLGHVMGVNFEELGVLLSGLLCGAGFMSISLLLLTLLP